MKAAMAEAEEAETDGQAKTKVLGDAEAKTPTRENYTSRTSFFNKYNPFTVARIIVISLKNDCKEM